MTEAIECVEPAGVRTCDGVLHPLDILVVATGFRVDRFVRPMHVVGDRGVVLDDVWGTSPFAHFPLHLRFHARWRSSQRRTSLSAYAPGISSAPNNGGHWH